MNETPCKKCQAPVKGEFCGQCGTPVSLKRINGGYVISQIVGVVNFDRGIFYTIKELFIRPGASVRSFIHTDRSRLVKPVIFVILCSLAYTLLQQWTKFEDGYVKVGGFGESTAGNIFAWIQTHYGYANILMSLFIAVWLKLFFRRHPYNFFEIIILLCFVMGSSMLLFSIFGVIEALTSLPILSVAGMLAFIYTSWAIGQFFDPKKVGSYLKSFLAYFLGMITFFILAIAVGMLIDMLIKP